MQSTSSSAGLPNQLQLGLLSPLYLRKLFERLGATYIKLGQVNIEFNFPRTICYDVKAVA